MTSRPLSFHLTRLVWLGLLPLLVLAVGLAAYHVQTGLMEKNASAGRRVKNYAALMDGFLEARIQSLEMLASSPLADEPGRRQDLYAEAQAFQRSFNSHVILADVRRQMLFNTRVPFGTPLPHLPEAQKGQSAAQVALATGKPAVGDIVQGPVANQPLVAIVVPGLREGKVRHLLLVTTTLRELQQGVDALPRDPDWAITVHDSAGGLIAGVAPEGFDSARDVDPDWRFTTTSRHSPWTVSVEVPRSVVRQPLYTSALLLLAGIALATLAGLLGTRRLARRIERQAVALVDNGPDRPLPDIEELAAARQRLDRQWGALSESQARMQQLIDLPHAALAMFDRDMRYLAVSRRWCDDYGLGDRAILGRFHYEIFPEIDQRWKDVHRRGLAGEVVTAEEDPFVRQDGSAQWLRWEVRPWYAADGSVGGVVIFSEDITESRKSRDAQARVLKEQRAARLAALNQMEDANTSRREAEAANAAMSASEARYRGVFEAANVGKSVTQPTGEIEVNRAFCDMLGYAPEELRGKTWQELTPADEIGPDSDRVASLLRGESDVTRFEKHYLHKSGSLVCADVSIATQRDGDGKPLHFITTVVDISERKRAERKVIESEARYRSLFENMNTGFVLFEVVQDDRGSLVDLVILAANQGFATTTGLNPENAIGQRLTHLLPGIEKDAADWIGTYGSIALSGVPLQFEQVSERLGVSYSVSAFRAGPGQCAVSFLDITGRKKTEQSLRDSEERLRLALDAARQGLYDLNLETGGVKVSSEYATMLGHDPQTFLETYDGWRERLHPDDRVAVFKILDDYLAGHLPVYRVEFRLRTHDGRWKWILSMGKIQEWSADKRPLRMLGTHTDIDALKAAESALLESNATLEARVAERTAELTAANRELETFAYAVSHDLRSPLRAMSGYAHALEEDFGASLQGQAKNYLDHIDQAVHKMGDLIDGLLALSRSSRGELQQDCVDLSAIARRRLAELAEAEPGRQVSVEVEDDLVTQGDEKMLASALWNLIDNAWKYTSATATPSIRVHVGEVGGQRGFCVSDNGAGFDMEQAGRLFQPFQRLHRQSEFPGIGIGLATVRRIVLRHGGEITAQAVMGEGATFCMALPQVPDRAAQAPTSLSS